MEAGARDVERRMRRANGIVGGLLVVETIALVVVLAVGGRPAGLTVVADVGGVFPVGRLLFSPAVILVVLLVAVFRLVAVVPAVASRRSAAVAAGLRTARWVEWGLVWPILLFVVARLNGIGHVGPLVGIYALASAVALFGILQDRVVVRHGHPRLPLAFGAAVGVVPWGIIAFRQVSGVIGGHPAAPIVVAVTLVALALQAVAFVVAWWDAAGGSVRGEGPVATDTRGRAPVGELQSIVVGSVAASVVAWLVVLGVG